MTTTIAGAPGAAPEWKAITTLSPAGVTNITAAGLPAYTSYRVVFSLTHSAAVDSFGVQINAVTSGYYGLGMTFSGAAAAAYSNAANMLLVTTPNSAQGFIRGEIVIGGVSTTGNEIQAYSSVGMSDVNTGVGAYFSHVAGAITPSGTQITSLKFLTATMTFTGTIIIYGRSDI